MKSRGFTLAEIIVVMLIIAVLVTVAIPKFNIIMESMRAKEGTQFLYNILTAEKRYAINHDDGDSTPDYTNDITKLDISIDLTPSNFYSLNLSATNPLANITRKDNSYTLFIADTGVISCNCGGIACTTCQKIGYPNQ